MKNPKVKKRRREGVDPRPMFKRVEERDGSRQELADAADVTLPTVSKWATKNLIADFSVIRRLHARGYITDDDLRAAGLAIPRREDITDVSTTESLNAPDAAKAVA